jgi:molecular chaperone GrpE (heat shock protein)
MNKIIITISLFTSLIACQKNAEDKQKTMINEVMAVHDEVMPKMDDIMSLKSSLDSAIKVSPDSAKAKTLYSNLDMADNQMMDWMENYDSESVKGKSAVEISKYFTKQKTKITEVKILTDKSIDEAKGFLGK